MDPEEELILGAAVREVAARCGVSHSLFKSVGELVKDIQEANPEVRGDLTDFMAAHLVWFRFHEDVKCRGELHDMSPDDTATLAQRVHERDAARTALIEALGRRKRGDEKPHSPGSKSAEPASNAGLPNCDRMLPAQLDSLIR